MISKTFEIFFLELLLWNDIRIFVWLNCLKILLIKSLNVRQWTWPRIKSELASGSKIARVRCRVRKPNPNYIDVLSRIYWQANVPNRRTLFIRPTGQVGNNLGPRARPGIIGRCGYVSLFKSRDELREAWDIKDRLAYGRNEILVVCQYRREHFDAVVYSSIINSSCDSLFPLRVSAIFSPQ